MQQDSMRNDETRAEECICQHCQMRKPVTAFVPFKGKTELRKKICAACEQWKLQERHRRVELQRAREHIVQEPTEHTGDVWEQRAALRHAYEARQREMEQWYLQQPERRCRLCQQVLPVTAFGGMKTRQGFVLHTRCRQCHEVFQAQRQLPCCLCQRKTPRRDFLSQYEDYALSGNGAWVSLCCRGCEPAFRALAPAVQQRWIAWCCQRRFPAGQFIYAEVDPQTGDIRYVGRTNRPKRRHAQHLSDVSPVVGQWGTERTARYTRRNWMYALAEQGLTPMMQVLHSVDVAPLVLEWEQRYIWHGMQQGWKLLNMEMMDVGLLARIQASSVDFLQAPFALLVQQHFFSSHGLEALLHQWSQAACLAG